jgi:integrase
MLLRAARIAGFEDETDYRLRPHDLRHTFAVHRVLAWYREGRDVNALLPALSAYMGHVNPAHTYTYLRSAELLYGEVTRRFERAANEAIDGGKA